MAACGVGGGWLALRRRGDPTIPMLVQDLGTMACRDAWALREAAHAEVLGGAVKRTAPVFVACPAGKDATDVLRG